MQTHATLKIPAHLYARLQALADREQSSSTAVLEQLINAGAQGTAIISNPELHGGRPIIAGTGTTVRTIAGLYKLGLSAEEIVGELPLTLAQVYAALAYYHLHTEEIEADIQADAESVLIGNAEGR
jgi:uncharacterized protein (DUF433 family)